MQRPALRLPDPEAALRPVHPGDGRAGLRDTAGPVPRRSARPSPRTPAGTARPRSPTRSAGPSTRSASSTSGPRRCSSCCSATSAARAAGSWRCAGTRPSRARPTSRPCTTCCPATSRCRTPTPTRTSTASSRARADGQGLLGQHAGLHGQPAQGVVGAGRHGGQRLLLRLPAPADRQPQHLRDRAGPDRRPVQGLLPRRGEPGGRLGQRGHAAARAWPTWTGWWSATSP